jgi:predicted MFS family arabinose efflux permease
MPPRFALTTLMLGNFVIGVSVLAPAGMLHELSKGLAVSIRDAGFLITSGAIVLCFGSPIAAWLTSRFDRRLLLAATLFTLAAGQFASALAPNYYTLLIVRVLMLAVGALYTPQAAGTATLLASPERRASAITYVFLGWSFATAIGLPLISVLATRVGWRETYAVLAAFALIVAVLEMSFLPKGLFGTRISFATWGTVMRNRLIVLLLLITAVQTSGQFTIFTYLGPLLTNIVAASPEMIGVFFAFLGIAGLIGNVIATRIVGSIGAFNTSALAFGSLLFGALTWTIGSGWIALMAAGVVFWGLGFASANSMQQARLAGAEPKLASASIALNTSAIYIGQAAGSYAGGLLFVRGMLDAMGWSAVAFTAAALVILAMTWSAKRAG